MLDEEKKFTKEAIKEIGEEFTAFRREFVPFANKYYGAKLQKMVKERMAVAEALNPGSTVRLGGHSKAAHEVEPEDAKPARRVRE